MCSIAAGISGGLSLFQGLAMRGAAKDAANQTYQQELEGTQSAEDNKRQKQRALSEGKEEKTVAARQDKFAKAIDTLKGTKALLAKGQVGVTTNLLVMDQIRQGANYNEKIRQSIESMNRQYLFDVKSTEAEYQGIRNRLRSNTINAYNQIPTTGSILLGAATSAFNTELGMENNIFNMG
jgi:cell division protein ZapA (FtsZ GTPase activity inhibitor)|tara:strand:- start:11431 stop:11970 length:540 start_codon:yes stop_codon:yes gene_type:complete